MWPKIGELLMEEKRITRDQLDHCLEYKKTNPKVRIGAVLRLHNFVDDYTLADCLARQINWKFFKGDYVPDFRSIEKAGLDYFLAHQIYPLKNGSCPAFVVSFIDEVRATDFLQTGFGPGPVEFYIGVEGDIKNALDGIVVEQKRQKLLNQIETFQAEGIESLASWLESAINLALMTRSTDIHLEPSGKTTDIRFRIDGLLVPVTCLKPEYMPKLANILLTKCKANPCDYRIQDGRFDHEFHEMGKKVDVRFSQIPSVHGPSIVLRLLDRDRASIPLQSLGYTAHNQALIRQAMIVPHGLTLVTGPTGSGKSTTLAAMLDEIKSITKKVMTIEDPVEISHSLMTQVEADPAQQLGFGHAIRSFLRHDPNVVLIGEIRDSETAEEALRAANTGLQIFSTLHTNDPISAILRLKDLGVDAVNISSCLSAVVSQRLARKLCPLCKTAFPADHEKLKSHELKYLTQAGQVIYKALGCERCRGGYLGRTVVAEVLIIDPEIKELVAEGGLGAIYALLRRRGNYHSMMDDMKTLILKGETSIEEAVRILG